MAGAAGVSTLLAANYQLATAVQLHSCTAERWKWPHVPCCLFVLFRRGLAMRPDVELRPAAVGAATKQQMEDPTGPYRAIILLDP